MSLGSASLGSSSLGSSGSLDSTGFEGSPQSLSLSSVGYVPQVTAGVDVNALQLSIPVTGLTPDIDITVSITPSQLVLSSVGGVPEVVNASSFSKSPSQLSVPSTYGLPTIQEGDELTTSLLTLSPILYSPSVNAGVMVVASQLILPSVGLLPEGIFSGALAPTILTLSPTGLQPSQDRTANFPPLSMKSFFDSKSFTVESQDPASKQVTDGGYTITRPKYWSKPKRKFTVGFVNLTQSDKDILEQFWNDKQGGTSSFTMTMPTGGADVVVRFDEKIKYTYMGHGDTRLWDVGSVKLIEN